MLIRLRRCVGWSAPLTRRCAGWSAPLMFAYGINRFSHDVAHLFEKEGQGERSCHFQTHYYDLSTVSLRFRGDKRLASLGEGKGWVPHLCRASLIFLNLPSEETKVCSLSIICFVWKLQCKIYHNWATTRQNKQNDLWPNDDWDQTWHPPSLISLRCPHEETLGP